MRGADRLRRSLLLASAAAIVPVAISAAPFEPRTISAAAPFVPPDGTLLLTRETRRALPGGIVVRSSRSYAIRFLEEQEGYRIEGKLVDVDVEVPPAFAALAELERRRSDEGLFPMHVDRAGQLIEIGTPEDDGSVQAAIRLANRKIEHSVIPADKRKSMQAFVGRFADQRALVAWPQDLFVPTPGKRSQNGRITLPEGVEGDVSVELEAQTMPGSGLLERFRRTVTTSVGTSSRVVEEVWTLSEN